MLANNGSDGYKGLEERSPFKALTGHKNILSNSGSCIIFVRFVILKCLSLLNL